MIPPGLALNFNQSSAAGVYNCLRDRLAPGSVVVLHATKTRTSQARVNGMTKAYGKATSPIIFRDEEDIAALAAGWTTLPPGLVNLRNWSADGTYQAESHETVRVVGMAAALPRRRQGQAHTSGGAR